jgi:hypothetical protein
LVQVADVGDEPLVEQLPDPLISQAADIHRWIYLNP